jgi:lipid A 3-O-deacylase
MPMTFLRRIAPAVLAAAVALSPAAHAEPPADPSSIWTLQIENDTTDPNSDQYYTSGLRLGYSSPSDPFSGEVADLGRALLGPGQQRFSIDLSQLIFTPHLKFDYNPPLTDRPYAGLLIGTASLITDTDTTRSMLGIGLGVIGPAAQGEEVQNGWHDLAGFADVNGWHSQIPDEPVIQITGDRIWRLPVADFDGLEVDALPEVTGGIGTFRIYGQAGADIRFGQGLRSDFGVPHVRPAMSGGDAYVQTQHPIAWYVFAGADGQVVAWDETLDGLPFGSSRRVTRQPFVGELHAGLTVMVGGVRVTASEVLQTAEFRTQGAGLFHYSSISLSVKF